MNGVVDIRRDHPHDVELPRSDYMMMLRYCIAGWGKEREACGLLVRQYGERHLTIMEGNNVADEPAHEFSLDPFVLRHAIEGRWTILGTWHSHLHVGAEPSALDKAMYVAVDEQFGLPAGVMRHLIVSMMSGQPVVAAWRVVPERGHVEPVTFAIAD